MSDRQVSDRQVSDRQVSDRQEEPRRSSWLARGTALLWTNVLVVLPMVLVWATVWGGTERVTTPDEVAAAALKVFAVWVLALLPGWLYIRFLGLRAGALWEEYVLHLHRLGWDDSQYLPEPPRASAYHREWEQAGGRALRDAPNLYRRKFDAYYGKAVSTSGASSSGSSTDFRVTTDSMFPVFLATIVLAAGWTAVLWDDAFATAPASVWDVAKFAFLGAYAFTTQSLVRRFYQSDLRPSAYAAVILRLVVVLTTSLAVYQLLGGLDPRAQAVVAFVIGGFPVMGLQALHRSAAAVLRTVVPQLTPDYPLHQIDGLNMWYEARLVEEGIEDMQTLATANVVDVMLHTRVPVGRIVDWLDQAHLYLHLDRVERTQRERATAARAESAADEAASADWAGPLRNSVQPGARAGTRTRVALRQLGIRNATDFLKAFPPDQVDPLRADEADPACFARVDIPGLDMHQVRLLSRVLSEDTGLACVWNWQARGVHALQPVRRPRSLRAAVAPDPIRVAA